MQSARQRAAAAVRTGSALCAANAPHGWLVARQCSAAVDCLTDRMSCITRRRVGCRVTGTCTVHRSTRHLQPTAAARQRGKGKAPRVQQEQEQQLCSSPSLLEVQRRPPVRMQCAYCTSSARSTARDLNRCLLPTPARSSTPAAACTLSCFPQCSPAEVAHIWPTSPTSLTGRPLSSPFPCSCGQLVRAMCGVRTAELTAGL